MLKKIAKFICPSSAKLADRAAESIQSGFNGISPEKRDRLARYTALAKRIGEMQAGIDLLVSDGKIDDTERERIASALEPLIEGAKEIVFG